MQPLEGDSDRQAQSHPEQKLPKITLHTKPNHMTGKKVL
jgi:hypothetical protein